MALTIITIYFAALVATLVWATISSGAATAPAVSEPQPSAGRGSRVSAPEYHSGENRSALPRACPSAHRAVRFYSRRLNEWRAKMGAGDHAGLRSRLLPGGKSCPRYLAHVLQRKAHAARVKYQSWRTRFRQLYEKWRCIHEHEGAWDSNTGNGYWGGLQMDWGFMHTYGPEFIRRWGLADRWPVWAQLVAAERAFHGFAGFGARGYSPWGTRGMCGV